MRPPAAPAMPDAQKFGRRLARDERGNFLVFVGMSVAVLFGMVALSFDLGRMAAVQTDLQSYADAVALAAAAELDGEGDSVTRAIGAAGLVSDTQSFAAGGRDLTSADYVLTFLKALPAADDLAADAAANVVCTGTGCPGLAAASQKDAVLVRVDVNPHDVTMSFASVVSAMTGGAQTVTGRPSAAATAGFNQYACDIAPLMFCLPRNAADTGPDTLSVGQMVKLRQGGGSGAWGPGNFGFLDVSDAYVDGGGTCEGETGANRIRCILGAVEAVTRCYTVRGVTTDTGNSAGITVNPFNFRFDLWGPGEFADSAQNDPDFAPAPNVIYGQEPAVTVRINGQNVPALASVDPCAPLSDGVADANNSNVQVTESSMGLPSGPFQTAAGRERFGDGTATFAVGTADRQAYMAANHNWFTGRADPFPNAGTRWEVYLAEIAAAGAGQPLLPPKVDATGAVVPLMTAQRTQGQTVIPPAPVPQRNAAGAPITNASGQVQYENVRRETGRPQCAPAGVSDPYRRVVVAAGIDCDPRTGTELNGHRSGVPVEVFYELFLTQPVRDEGGGNFDMFGEVIGIAGGTGSGSTSNGIFRDVVQLYR